MTLEAKSASYLSAAQSLFNILKQDYQDNDDPRVFMGSTNYWMAGNVFDTALDYMRLAMANNMITRQEVDSVLAYVSKNYDQTHQSYNATYYYYNNDNGIPGGSKSCGPASATGSWYDDYCWWGIASAKAYSSAYQTIFQNYTNQFEAIARSCWNVVEKGIKVDTRPARFGAPNVWANCDQKVFAAVEPRITGGAWQCDINDCSNPFKSSLGPFQDTVMNGLYMVFALRMNKAIGTLTQINREYKFLATWCFGKDIKEDERLFYNIPNKGGMVLERIATYKNGQPVPPEWWHDVHTAWCGDQGLMLGAMVDFRKTNPDEPAKRLIEGIMQGVPENMQLKSILMPWYPLTNNPLESTDKADYASGVGVFMRYLLYAYKNSPTVKGWVDSNQYGIKDMILNNADTCVMGNFPKYGNGIFDLFNRLSILITAATILQGADEAAEAENSAD